MKEELTAAFASITRIRLAAIARYLVRSDAVTMLADLLLRTQGKNQLRVADASAARPAHGTPAPVRRAVIEW
jgi:hypothetical protein